MKKKNFISPTCALATLSFVFFLLTAVKHFPPICYFLLNFLLDFFFLLWVSTFCFAASGFGLKIIARRSSFDAFKCLTPPPDFCLVSLSYQLPSWFFLPAPLPTLWVFGTFQFPNAGEKLTCLQHPSLPIRFQLYPLFHMAETQDLRFGISHRWHKTENPFNLPHFWHDLKEILCALKTWSVKNLSATKKVLASLTASRAAGPVAVLHRSGEFGAPQGTFGGSQGFSFKPTGFKISAHKANRFYLPIRQI